MTQSTHDSINNYTNALATDNMAKGCKQLMEYVMSLRTHSNKTLFRCV